MRNGNFAVRACAKDYFCEKISANVIQCNVFIFENKRRTGFDVNTLRENYLVVSFHMVTRGIFRTQPNICDGPFFAKRVNDYKPLTIFAKRLCHRCLTGF